ncbi:MAG TPA: extracellular solute-binding protein, partial [Xanthobacteraceae bacterium]|nr:extracellular solute-binding protein [Xanthobacteraceae bacterium]
RSLLRGSAALAAAGALGRPYVAHAAAKTAHVWWTQGFISEEDAAFKNVVAAYEKASGNILDVTIIPFGPMVQKIVSALTSGDVPDLMQNFNSAFTIVPQNAWNDKLVDVSDVMETQKSHFHPTAFLSTQYYNNVTKKRGFYLVPDRCSVLPFHIWNSLVEKAGFKMSDAPKTWDAFWDFFKPMQKELRAKGMRGLYSLGLQATTTGPADGNNMFHQFLITYGGNRIVTPDGAPHLDDPAVKEAAVKALAYITTAFKEGYVPPGALSWNDADDNNAFHAKQIIMDLDGTISTELALYRKKEEYDDVVTMGLPHDNAGQPVPSQLGVGGAFIPKGAKNMEVAKDFIKYVIQPEVANEYLKQGLGRWLPAIPELVNSDPFWLDATDPHRVAYVRQGVLGPTVPIYPVFNPGYAEANAQQIWGAAEAEVIREGATPEAAAETALRRIGAILAKYPIVES